MDLPTRRYNEVFHIGSLNPADKGRTFSSSYEGHGLSVSDCPEEWERIARLGGNPWWELTNPSGRFIDVHALSAEERQAIEEWGIDRGLARRVEGWRVSYYDSEWEDTVSFLYLTEKEARAEMDELPDQKLDATEILQGTALLDEKMGFETALDCLDFLLVSYAEDETELDGVWWEDIYGHLSAPRGVILPSKLTEWQTKQIRGPELSDVSALKPVVGDAEAEIDGL